MTERTLEDMWLDDDRVPQPIEADFFRLMALDMSPNKWLWMDAEDDTVVKLLGIGRAVHPSGRAEVWLRYKTQSLFDWWYGKPRQVELGEVRIFPEGSAMLRFDLKGTEWEHHITQRALAVKRSVAYWTWDDAVNGRPATRRHTG